MYYYSRRNMLVPLYSYLLFLRSIILLLHIFKSSQVKVLTIRAPQLRRRPSRLPRKLQPEHPHKLGRVRPWSNVV